MDKDIKDKNGISLNKGRPLINGLEYDWNSAVQNETRLIIEFGPIGHEVGYFWKTLSNDNIAFSMYDGHGGETIANAPKRSIWVDVNFKSPMADKKLKETIKKSELKQIIKECIDEVQQEGKPTINKKTVINRIYKVIQPITNKVYNDEYWTGLKDLIRAIKSIGYDVSVDKSEYKNNSEGVPTRKEYDIIIHDKDVEVLKGKITAAFDGTPEDPMKRYDLTLVMW